jgi:hypothetical protein
MTSPASWLRCYRCWSQNLEVQVHYEGTLKVDAETGEANEPIEETHEAVVQCLDCLHDQPHLALGLYEEGGRRVRRLEAIDDRWERLVLGPRGLPRALSPSMATRSRAARAPTPPST